MKLETEEEIQREYDNLKAWENLYGVHVPEYKQMINEWLSIGGVEEIQKLQSLFHNLDFLHHYIINPDMAYMQVVVSIYEDELNENEEHTILDGRSSMEEVEQFLLQLKFMIWRVEQDFDENAYQEFLDFKRLKNVSVIAIKYVIHTSAMKKAETLYKLGSIFEQVGMVRYAFVLFKYANEIQPGDPYILDKLAKICFLAGKNDIAEHYLSMIDECEGDE